MVSVFLIIGRTPPAKTDKPTGGQLIDAGINTVYINDDLEEIADTARNDDSADDHQNSEEKQQHSAEDQSPHQELISSEAYLSVQIQNVVYDPIPLLQDNELEIIQADGRRNVIAFTRDSIMMKSSNCANGDCIHQGVVTLENLNKRVLKNMIICLPNEIILTLLTPEEAQENLY